MEKWFFPRLPAPEVRLRIRDHVEHTFDECDFPVKASERRRAAAEFFRTELNQAAVRAAFGHAMTVVNAHDFVFASDKIIDIGRVLTSHGSSQLAPEALRRLASGNRDAVTHWCLGLNLPTPHDGLLEETWVREAMDLAVGRAFEKTIRWEALKPEIEDLKKQCDDVGRILDE